MTDTTPTATDRPDKAAWEALIAEFQAAEADLAATQDGLIADGQIDRLLDARLAVMAAPAPDGQALAMKLEILLEDDNGWIPQWRRDLVLPVIADAKRLAETVPN